jgi:hypothetical protein
MSGGSRAAISAMLNAPAVSAGVDLEGECPTRICLARPNGFDGVRFHGTIDRRML